MPKPHKHAEVIKAWADGAVIECKSPVTGMWMKADNPIWHPAAEYRVKPERVYPKTTLSPNELKHVYANSFGILSHTHPLTEVANAAIKRYIEENNL